MLNWLTVETDGKMAQMVDSTKVEEEFDKNQQVDWQYPPACNR